MRASIKVAINLSIPHNNHRDRATLKMHIKVSRLSNEIYLSYKSRYITELVSILKLDFLNKQGYIKVWTSFQLICAQMSMKNCESFKHNFARKDDHRNVSK